MDNITSLPRPKAGRPTREQAQARHHELLETALDHFLDKGFEMATIEAIAQSVAMTKRTVYARYPDKVALFRAAVNLAIERYSAPQDSIEATDCGDIEQTLRNLARLRINHVMSPNGLKLQRIIATESYRFPDIFNAAYEYGSTPAVKFLAKFFRRETEAGRLSLPDPFRAATTFMSMVVSGPVRIIVSGNYLSETEIDERVSFAVRLFLDGARPR